MASTTGRQSDVTAVPASPHSPDAPGLIPDFGDQPQLEASLSQLVNGLPPSGILRIVNDIRAHVAAGRTVVDLSMGDF